MCTRITKRKGKEKQPTGKRKQAAKTSADPDLPESNESHCGMCSKTNNVNEEWICFDSCCTWYQRKCLGINDEDWNYFPVPTSIYVCPMCR